MFTHYTTCAVGLSIVKLSRECQRERGTNKSELGSGLSQCSDQLRVIDHIRYRVYSQYASEQAAQAVPSLAFFVYSNSLNFNFSLVANPIRIAEVRAAGG